MALRDEIDFLDDLERQIRNEEQLASLTRQIDGAGAQSPVPLLEQEPPGAPLPPPEEEQAVSLPEAPRGLATPPLDAPVEEPVSELKEPVPEVAQYEPPSLTADRPEMHRFGDHLKETYGTRGGPLRFVPFLHSAPETIELVDTLAAIRRAKKGEYADTYSGRDKKNRDERLIADYQQKMYLEGEQRKADKAEAGAGATASRIGYNIGETASHIPAFVMEFVATAGMYQVARFAARKGVRKGLTGVLKNKAARIGTARLAGATAGTAARTSFFSVPIAARTAKEMIPDYDFSENEAGELALTINEDGKNAAQALAIGYVDSFIENLSEVSGPAIARAVKKLPGARRAGMVKLALAKKYLSGARGASVAKMRKKLAKGGWNGMFEEWGEERVGDALRLPVGLQSVEGAVAGWTDPEQIATELGAFAMPGAGQMAAASIQEGINAPKRKRAEKAYGLAFNAAVNTQKNLPSTEEAFLDALEAQYGPKSSLEIDNEATAKKKAEADRDPNDITPPPLPPADRTTKSDTSGTLTVSTNDEKSDVKPVASPSSRPKTDQNKDADADTAVSDAQAQYDAALKAGQNSELGKQKAAFEAKIRDGDLSFDERKQYEDVVSQYGKSPDGKAVESARKALEDAQRAQEQPKDKATAPDKSVVAGQPVAADPSEAQKEAGNYPKGHAKVDGLDVTIENPVGSERSGKDKTGKEWKQKLHSDYGYIKGTVGYDKDHLDVFIKPGYKGGGDVYVIDQATPTNGKDRKFDEHKVILGASSEADAILQYTANYEKEWKGFDGVTRMTMDAFKSWAYSKDDGPTKGRISKARLLRHDNAGRVAAIEKNRTDNPWPAFLSNHWAATTLKEPTAFTDARLKAAGITRAQVVKAITDAIARGVPEDFILDRSKYTATDSAYRDIVDAQAPGAKGEALKKKTLDGKYKVGDRIQNSEAHHYHGEIIGIQNNGRTVSVRTPQGNVLTMNHDMIEPENSQSTKPQTINGHGRRFTGVVPGDLLSGSGKHSVTFVRRSGDKVYWKDDEGGTGWMWARTVDSMFSHDKKINRDPEIEAEKPAAPKKPVDLKAELADMSDDDFDSMFDEAVEEAGQKKNESSKNEVPNESKSVQPGNDEARDAVPPKDAGKPPKKRKSTPAQERARKEFARKAQAVDQKTAQFRERHKYIRRPNRDDSLYNELASKEHGAIPQSRFRNHPSLSYPDQVFDEAVSENLATADEDMADALRRIFRGRLKTVGQQEKEESSQWDAAAEDHERQMREDAYDSFLADIEAGIRPAEHLIEEFRPEWDRALEAAGVSDEDILPDSAEIDDVDDDFDVIEAANGPDSDNADVSDEDLPFGDEDKTPKAFDAYGTEVHVGDVVKYNPATEASKSIAPKDAARRAEIVDIGPRGTMSLMFWHPELDSTIRNKVVGVIPEQISALAEADSVAESKQPLALPPAPDATPSKADVAVAMSKAASHYMTGSAELKAARAVIKALASGKGNTFAVLEPIANKYDVNRFFVSQMWDNGLIGSHQNTGRINVDRTFYIPPVATKPKPESVDDFKKKHGLNKPEQDEMFGKGAVGDKFVLSPEKDNGDAQKYDEQQKAQEAAEKAERDQGKMDLGTRRYSVGDSVTLPDGRVGKVVGIPVPYGELSDPNEAMLNVDVEGQSDAVPVAATQVGKAPDSGASDAIKNAAKHGVKGIDDAMKGLNELFGGGKHMGMGVTFDEETYAKAKPHFESALAEFQSAGKSIKEFFQFIVAQFGDSVKPYLKRFKDELGGKVEAAPDPAPAASDTPSLKVAQEVMASLQEGVEITKAFLQKAMNRQYGGTMAEGKYTIKDMNDAMELGINMFISSEMFDPSSELAAFYMTQGDAGSAKEMAAHYGNIESQIPTQTNRTPEQDQKQQFSTPPSYAYVVNWVANVQKGDVYLEPSAGLGGLAVFGKVAGAKVIANELSDRRASLLKDSGIADTVTTHNAELINAMLDPAIKRGDIQRPTVVVMNPPFSNSATTSKKSMTVGTKHVDQALAVLRPGGRLVAIIGGPGHYGDSNAVKTWLSDLGKRTNLRAIVDVDGAVYGKYGTTFGTRVLVIDKPGPTDTFGLKKPKTGTVQTLAELIDFLSEVRDERSTDIATEGDSGKEPAGDASGTAGDRPEQRPTGSDAVGAESEGGSGEESSGSGTASPGDSRAERPENTGTPEGAPERTPVRGPESSSDADNGSNDSRRGDREGPRVESELELEDAEPLEADEASLDDERIYDNYVPKFFRMKGAKPHPTAVVESASMAAVSPPEISYLPNLPIQVVANGDLSLIQLEAIAYAGQAHTLFNPDGSRRGFIIGDGTGVGKGREISGIMLDNWRSGRRKAVWISEKAELVNDARRDIRAVAGEKLESATFDMTKVKSKTGAIKQREGVLFTTYTTLANLNRGFDSDGNRIVGARNKKSRMDQIVEWLGKDFDGVIALDEAHNAANNMATRGKRGTKAASKKALAVVDLQKALPKARIVYVTATAATEVSNLGYLERIGMWGHGTPFSSKSEFIANVSEGGVSSMEVVARDLKALGLMTARTLSFEGVEFRPPEETIHKLTPDQRDLYNTLARAWQLVMQTMDQSMQQTGQAGNGQALSRARSAFFGAELRFYNQLLTSLQMPSVIADIKKDLASGKSVVIQLINTNEAALKRELDRLAGEESVEYDDLDLTTRNILLHYLDNSFPTGLYQEVEDEHGNVTVRPVMDAETGQQVQDPEAVQRKNELMDHIASLAFPDNPIEMILNEFGYDQVAEITGRSSRVVMKENEDGQVVRSIERNRTDTIRDAEALAFDNGDRRILIFSDKGGTGRSYHASLDIPNQQRRAHHVIQAGWRADKCIQGFGRSHRSSQSTPPVYGMWSTDINGHKRFIATIARRLQQLGALSSGERKAAGKGMFSEKDNVESAYGASAVRRLFRDWFSDPAGIGGMTFVEMTEKLGYRNMVDEETGQLNEDALPPVSTFLNRILALEIDEQNRVFDAFMDRMGRLIDNAIERGNYDPGLQTYKADKIKKLKDEVVYTHPESKAVTRLVEVEAQIKKNFTTFADIGALGSSAVLGYARNLRTGKLVAIKDGPDQTSTATGRVSKGRRLISPESIETHSELDVTVASIEEATPPAPAEFSTWEYDEEEHSVTGKLSVTLDTPAMDAVRSLFRQEGYSSQGTVVLADGIAIALGESQDADKARLLEIINDVIQKRFDIDLKKKYRYAALTEESAREQWDEHIKTSDPYHRRTETFVVGTLLPIWDRLRIDPRVFRFQTTEGEKILGVHVSPSKVEGVRNRLGAGVGSAITADSAFELVMNDGLSLSLANGWSLSRRKVSGEWRIELMGVHEAAYFSEFENYVGGFIERINYKPRLFVPTSKDDGVAALEKIIAKSPIAEVIAAGGGKLTSLDDIRASVGRQVDDFIGGGESMQGGLPLPIDTPKKKRGESILLPGDERLQSNSADVEKRWRAARLQRPGMISKLTGAVKAIYHSFTRSFRHLDSRDGATKDVLRQFEEIPNYSRAMTIDVLRGLLAELSPHKYDVFSRLVILPDLLQDIDNELYAEGATLPFGYKNREAIIEDINKFQTIADLNPAIGRALEQRKLFMDALRADLIRADLLNESVLDDPAYFHHQVLQYMNGQDFIGTGTSSRDVRAHRKGWQRARSGSSLDYNTQYVEAEFEVISQAMAQLATKETLDRLDGMLNISGTLKSEVKYHNIVAAHGGQEKYDRVQTLRQMLRETDDRKEKALIHEELNDIDVLAPFRMRIIRSKAVIAKLLKAGDIDVPRRFQQAASDIQDMIDGVEEGDEGAQIDEHIDQGNFMQFISWLSEQPGSEKRPALGIFKAIADKQAFIKSAAGENFQTIDDVIPEGYVKWQPEQGNRFFWALTTTEKVVTKAIEQNHILAPEEYSKSIVLGGRKTEWVIPERIATTLDNIQADTDAGTLDKLAQMGIGSWKVWTLLNPFRVFKYNLNNMSGDLDIVLAYNPKILKHGLQAAQDLIDYHLKKKSATKEIAQAIKLGVIGSGWSVQELPDVSTQDFFATLTGQRRNPARWWWDKTKSVTQWREDILRLAAFRYFKAELAKRDGVYAASRKSEIDAIENKNEKAAKLSRELVGDYGALSESGMWIRRRVIPFYSWMEINLPRYVRLMKNTKHEGGTAGKGVRGIAAVSWRVGALAFKANLMFVAISLYNRLVWPDEDEELRRERRKGHYIILGRDEDGDIRTLRFEGALSDALAWFDLEDYPKDIADIAKGNATIMDKVKDAAWAVGERYVLGSRPIERTLIEAYAFRKQLWPDIRHPRPVRDPQEHVARAFSLNLIYQAAAGKPSKGARHNASSLFMYKTDTGEAAYYTIRGLGFDYLERKGVEKPSHTPTRRQNYLYYYKTALRYGDKRAAEKYLEKYMNTGGSERGKSQSIASAATLSIIPRSMRDDFEKTLSPVEKRMLVRADLWYKKTYRPSAKHSW